jgi:tRNA(Met) C34 N-acetyltransferase TmcA
MHELVQEAIAIDKAATKPRPKNDAELKRYLMDTFAVTLPDTVVEAGHSTPFRAFSDAYFARSGVAVWKASRGFGGKSFLLSLLGAVEAETLGAEITVLGGSGEQATRVQEYMGQWFTRLGYDSNKRETTLPNGGRTRALMASQKSIRGPHPQRLRIDEADDVALSLLFSLQSF